jgi:3-isopropylmalate/(R)-2-methylmalate dehydratase small subunit
MKAFNGEILFLDRADINTDEIIPARYLTEIEKAALKPHLMEDLCLDGFMARDHIPGKAVIVTRDNFGCGSSREHAPWALEVNGINLVIAPSFARIFQRNMFNCGMLAVALAPDTVAHLFDTYRQGPAQLTTDLDRSLFAISGAGRSEEIPFELSDFDRALVEAGGWVEYADRRY